MIPVVLAMLLDAAMGEPRWLWSRLPHPAVLMGRAVAWCDQRFNTGDARKAKGVLAMTGLVIGAGVLGALVQAIGGPVAVVIVGAILLAQRSLVDHVAAVSRDLRLSLGDGRRAVAMIVSRDTGAMDQTAVARSAIESAAENLSDGVIAPLFWFLLGGLPGLLIYKITNTADSMIGYRTPRHRDFGWAAARFDDVLNWVPARITAGLFWMMTPRLSDWPAIRTEARRHKSPNAGWPEAALARVLNVALAGPRSYDGVLTDFPFVHPQGARTLGPDDIDRAVRALWTVWGMALLVVVLFTIV